MKWCSGLRRSTGTEMRAPFQPTTLHPTNSLRSKRTSGPRGPSMPITLSSRVEDDFAILEVDGSLTLGPSLSTLRETARRILDETNVAGLILQVNEASTTDSAGLGELTLVYTLATKRRCPIMMVGVTSTLQKMLEVTHLDALLPSAT